MKYLIVAIIIFFGLGFFLSSCGPDEGMDCKVVCDSVRSAPQDLLDYFVFNEGSYWVYQLKGTDTLDTLSFAGMDSEYFEKKASCNYGIPPCEMQYTLFLNHSNLERFPPSNLKINSSNEIFSIGYLANTDQWGVIHLSGNKGVSDLSYFLSHPFIPNQQYTETTFLADTAIEVSVPKGTFKCIQTKSQVANPEGTIMSMYWSKKIGLIKYQISTDQTWELINYHHI